MANEKMRVQGIDIQYKHVNEKDFISLTDIARYRNADYPSDIIQNWKRKPPKAVL